MLKNKRIDLLLILLLFCLFILSACGPSPEDLAATAATSTPTVTPTPTPIPTRTPTPIPTIEPFILKINEKPPLEIYGFSVGSFIYGYAVLDLNDDNLNDLVYGGPVWRNSENGFVNELAEITILLNKGDGQFVHGTDVIFPQLAPSLVHARDAKTADFNGDGNSDIFIVGHGYDKPPFPGEENILILSQSDGSYADLSDQLNNPVLGFTHSCAAGDIDNDNDIDLIAADLGPVYVLVNDGTGTFTSHNLPISTSSWTSSELVDLNHDNTLDLVLGAGNSDSDSVVLWNSGDGIFGSDVSILPSNDGYPITTDILPFDLNSDGIMDLIITRTSESPFYAGSYYQGLINDGNKAFVEDQELRFPDHNLSTNWVMRLEKIDLDLDGDQDLITLYDLAESNKTELIWINDGDGVFSLLILPESIRGTMIPIDVENDGDKDFLVLTVQSFGNVGQVQRWSTVINNTK